MGQSRMLIEALQSSSFFFSNVQRGIQTTAPGYTGCVRGVLSARQFVWWYNGHPAGANVQLDLSRTQNVLVLGLGNVALDCARLLLSPPERLAPTDIAERALQRLRCSTVQGVHLVARRGPAEVCNTSCIMPSRAC